MFLFAGPIGVVLWYLLCLDPTSIFSRYFFCYNLYLLLYRYNMKASYFSKQCGLYNGPFHRLWWCVHTVITIINLAIFMYCISVTLSFIHSILFVYFNFIYNFFLLLEHVWTKQYLVISGHYRSLCNYDASETPGNVKRVHVFSSQNINGPLLSKATLNQTTRLELSEIKVQKLSLGRYLLKGTLCTY